MHENNTNNNYNNLTNNNTSISNVKNSEHVLHEVFNKKFSNNNGDHQENNKQPSNISNNLVWPLK